MRIRMTSDAKGALTSTDIREHKAGHEYELPAELAEAYVSMGVAEPVADEAPAEPDKAADEAQAEPEKPATRRKRGA